MKTIIRVSVLTLIFGILFNSPLSAQKTSDDITVGTVAGDKVSYGELVRNYNSSASGPYTLEDLKEFLPVYLDYKAKIKSARDLGYYSDSTIQKEYRQYAKQAAYSYWLEKRIRPEKFKQYYDRAQYEVKAFHILIEVPKNAGDKKIKDILADLEEAKVKIKEGTPLEDVNRQYSSIKQGRSMGGELPWFSVGRTVEPFEDVVYNLEVGEVSDPVETRFGYHVILLLDKRERTKARKVQHIYLRDSRDSTSIKKIQEAYTKLEQGTPWTEVVSQYSQDERSKRQNGLIGWVNYGGNYAEALIDSIMAVDLTKDYSHPMKTPFGYHIFRIDSVRQYESEEQKKQELMDQLEDTPYFSRSNGFVVQYLQRNMGSEMNEGNLNQLRGFLAASDTTQLNQIKLPSDLAPLSLYSFKGEEFTVSDFMQYLRNTRGSREASMFENKWVGDFLEYNVDRQIVELTLEEFPEFENQSESYQNGLVVYQINEDSVWSAATVDTTRLENIYESNKDKYRYTERPHYYLISSSADSTLEKVKDFVRDGNSPDSIRSHIKRVSMVSDSTNTFQNEPFDRLQTMEPQTFSDIFEYNGRKALFYLQDWLPARRMTFEEAFNRLLADFQDTREQEWMESLRSKYEIKPDYKGLEKAYNMEVKNTHSE